MVKVYKATNYLSVPIVMNGKIVGYADFTDEHYTYSTRNKDIQKSLESLPCFNSLFKLLRKVEDKPEKKETKKSFNTIKSWQEAKNVLATKYKVDESLINTPESIIKKADELNISFPNLKLQ